MSRHMPRGAVLAVVAPLTLLLIAASTSAFWSTSGGGTGSASAAATWSTADTQAPVITAGCPAASGTYASGNGNSAGTWRIDCAQSVTVNVTDNVGVASAAVKLTRSGVPATCWTGADAASNFTALGCTAVNATYGAGYVALTAGTGSKWSRALAGNRIAAGSYTLEVLAKDAAGNTATKATITFTVT